MQLHCFRVEEFRFSRLAMPVNSLVMRRIPTAELLDDDLGTPAEIRKSLDDLWRINRWLGGERSSLRLLDRVIARTGLQSLRILDAGAGDARLADRLQTILRQRDISADFVALDRRHSHLRDGGAQAHRAEAIAADVFHLPFCEKSFDVVMCNLLLHHFSEARAIELLLSWARFARQAVIVNDLERNALPYLFIRLAYPFARSRITRHDGPASVRQAYTREELRSLAMQVGFRDFIVERLVPFRLGLTIWTMGGVGD